MPGGIDYRNFWSDQLVNSELKYLARSLARQAGATPEVIEKAMVTLGVTPPPDYIEFLMESNGAEGLDVKRAIFDVGTC